MHPALPQISAQIKLQPLLPEKRVIDRGKNFYAGSRCVGQDFHDWPSNSHPIGAFQSKLMLCLKATCPSLGLLLISELNLCWPTLFSRRKFGTLTFLPVVLCPFRLRKPPTYGLGVVESFRHIFPRFYILCIIIYYSNFLPNFLVIWLFFIQNVFFNLFLNDNRPISGLVLKSKGNRASAQIPLIAQKRRKIFIHSAHTNETGYGE